MTVNVASGAAGLLPFPVSWYSPKPSNATLMLDHSLPSLGGQWSFTLPPPSPQHSRYVPTVVAPADLFIDECGAAGEGAGPSGMGTSSNSSCATAWRVKATAHPSVCCIRIPHVAHIQTPMAKPNIMVPVSVFFPRYCLRARCNAAPG